MNNIVYALTFSSTNIACLSSLTVGRKDRKPPSGYTVGQTWGALHKAWLGYCIALSKNEDENALLYAPIVQNPQRELGIQVRENAEIDMFGSAIERRIKAGSY